MTEPDLEAMQARFRPRLTEERAAVLAASAETEAARKPVELDQQAVGRLSRMDAMQGQAMAAALEARRHGRLKAIDAALARLETDEFGWCDACGEFIGEGRLNFDPTVMRCVGCAG